MVEDIAHIIYDNDVMGNLPFGGVLGLNIFLVPDILLALVHHLHAGLQLVH